MTRLSLALFALLSSIASGQTLVRNLTTTSGAPRDTRFYRNATVGGTAYFFAEVFPHGFELFKSDGTAAGTSMVADFVPGEQGGTVFGQMTLFNGQTVIAGSSSVFVLPAVGLPTEFANVRCSQMLPAGSVLFCADGGSLFAIGTTGAVTTLRSSSGSIDSMTLVGSRLFFVGTDGALWISDGTPATTVKVKALRPSNTVGSIESELVTMGGQVYFAGDDGVSGLELWRSDGTPSGTVLVKDVRAGPAGSFLVGITVAPRLFRSLNRLWFFADDGSSGVELFSSDGTTAGTLLVQDLGPGNSFTFSSTPGFLGDVAFFSGRDGELWSSNGTGAALLKDLNPGSSRADPSLFQTAGNLLYFTALGPLGFGLFRTDGTAAGTVHLKTIAVGSSAGLGAFGNTLLFEANDGVVGSELWKSDGTAAGTVLVSDLSPGHIDSSTSPADLTVRGTELVFAGRDPADRFKRAIFATDGTAANTRPLAAGLSFAAGLSTAGSAVVFTGSSTTAGRELWSVNGGVAALLKDIFPGTSGSLPSGVGVSSFEFVSTNGKAFFRANDGINGTELWVTDGTSAGTRLTGNLASGSNSVSRPVALGSSVYLFASDGGSAGLFVSDGTAVGTTRVQDIGPLPANLSAVGNTLFFTHGASLWKSDGTASGTASFAALPSSLVRRGGALGNRWVLLTSNSTTDPVQTELWVTDGSAAGTLLLKVLGPNPSLSLAVFQTPMVERGGQLYFFYADALTGRELWKTDGTPAGTARVADVFPGSFSGSPAGAELVAAGDAVFFTAGDPANGYELWKSDGTTAGTQRVSQIAPGRLSSNPRHLTVEEPYLYFSAVDGQQDEELWALNLGLDSTPPEITPSLTGVQANGWYRSNVLLRWTVVDAESSVASTTGCADLTVAADTPGQTVSCSATSKGGTATRTATFKRDATPPSVSCGPALTVQATGANLTVVTYPLPAATDAYDPAPTVSLTPPSGSGFPLGRTPVSVTATDHAGNQAQCTFDVVVVAGGSGGGGAAGGGGPTGGGFAGGEGANGGGAGGGEMGTGGGSPAPEGCGCHALSGSSLLSLLGLLAARLGRARRLR